MKINIIFWGGFSYPHGLASTKRMKYFIEYFIKKEVAVLVVVIDSENNASAKSNAKNNISYLKFPLKGLKNKILLPSNLLYFLYKGIKLIGNFKKNVTNIMYLYNGIDIKNIFFVIYAKLLGYKIITEYVEDFSFIQEKTSFIYKLKIISEKIIEKRIYKIADGIVTISKNLHAKFIKKCENKIPVVHIPISAEIKNNNKKLNFNTIPIIAYSGSFAVKDNLPFLIKTINKINYKENIIELQLSGTGKNYYLYKELYSSESVKFLGLLDDSDFYSFIANADILCMSRSGDKFSNAGFPFKLGEYLATGNPVIASKVSDVEDYLINLEDAILVDPDNSEQLESAIFYLLDDFDRAKKIGVNGQIKCREFFNPTSNCLILENLIRNL